MRSLPLWSGMMWRDPPRSFSILRCKYFLMKSCTRSTPELFRDARTLDWHQSSSWPSGYWSILFLGNQRVHYMTDWQLPHVHVLRRCHWHLHHPPAVDFCQLCTVYSRTWCGVLWQPQCPCLRWQEFCCQVSLWQHFWSWYLPSVPCIEPSLLYSLLPFGLLAFILAKYANCFICSWGAKDCMTSPCRVVIPRAAIVSLLFLSKDVSSAFFIVKMLLHFRWYLKSGISPSGVSSAKSNMGLWCHIWAAYRRVFQVSNDCGEIRLPLSSEQWIIH